MSTQRGGQLWFLRWNVTPGLPQKLPGRPSEIRSLGSRLASTTNILCYLWYVSYLLWALDLETLKGSSIPKMFIVLCFGSWVAILKLQRSV